MPAFLMIGTTKVAEWTGTGGAPMPIAFAADSGVATATTDPKWPYYPGEDPAGGTGDGRAYRGSPVAVAGLNILVPFYIFRNDRIGTPVSPWGSGNATATLDSYKATTLSPNTDPVDMTWVNGSQVVFRVTSVETLRANSAVVSAVIGSTGEPYPSNGVLGGGGGDTVVITAAPLADGEGHDASSTPAMVFWKWVCEETGDVYTTEQITITAPPSETTKTFTAYWRPKSVLFELDEGDNDIETAHYSTAGLYYSKDATGEPTMPMFYARVVAAQAADKNFKQWTRTVDTIDATSGQIISGAAVVVTGTVDPAYPEYEAVQTVRETGELATRVVYRAYSSFSHDRVACAVANTYLLQGAGFTKSPAVAAKFGADGYAGEYGLTYNQPTVEGVTYTVKCRKAGDLTGAAFEGADSGAFVDSETGKLWSASYILYAVSTATGEPVGPIEDPTVPEDPDDPDLPGIPGGGGGGGGRPVGTGISLQIVTDEAEVTAGAATLSLGGAAILSVTYPASPLAVKDAAEGTVYLLTVSDLAPAQTIVRSVKANGTAIVQSAGKWPIPAGTGITSVVVTLGFPPLKQLLVNAVSYPEVVAPAVNAVTVSPAPVFTEPNRWVAGTFLTLTAVPAAGYSNTIWQRDDAAGFHDEEPGGADYAFALEADTVVTAGFRKPDIAVVLTVKGSTALEAAFGWTAEAADADDTVPASLSHDLVMGTQIGIFKNGTFAFEGREVDSRLQTANDATYNNYKDMTVKAVEVSYDGGVNWVDAGATYVDLYNAQATPADITHPIELPDHPAVTYERPGRPAARLGKHTLSATQTPLKNTLHVRIRLVASVSVSVGMPPVRWGGPSWQAAGSMIGTGQNNWGCGFGEALVSGKSAATGLDVSAGMAYRINTLANPTATIALATLAAQEESPYPSYFNEYPYIDVELGDTVNVSCTPASGFYFAAWVEGYFTHAWDKYPTPANDTERLSEDRLVWPAANFISMTSTSTVTVNEGMKKIMLKTKAAVGLRYVLFTQDRHSLLRQQHSTETPNPYLYVQKRPSVNWSRDIDKYSPYDEYDDMKFLPITSAGTVWVDTLLSAWGVTAEQMLALDIKTVADESEDTNISQIWKVNISNAVTVMHRASFFPYFSWSQYDSERFDTDRAYLGVYVRVHSTDKDGVRRVSPWSFVSRGEEVFSKYNHVTYISTMIQNMDQRFGADLEYRVRWLVETVDGGDDDPYSITVGYQQTEDMEQGVVAVEIDGVLSDDINTATRPFVVQPDGAVILHATPHEGFTFVSWVNAAGDVIPEAGATYTVNHATDGVVFLANFTKTLVDDPDNTTEFHTGFVAGNEGRGSLAVRIWRGGVATDYTVTAQAGALYQLAAGDTAYVAAIAAEGWDFGGWVDSSGVARGSLSGYDPLADAGSGVALWRDAFFSEHVDPPVDGAVPFRVGFLNPSDVPHAMILVYVNGLVVTKVNGRQVLDMKFTEGDVVSLEVVVSAGRKLSGFTDLAYEPVELPVTVLNESVTGQGVLVLLKLDDPPIDPPPGDEPGKPLTDAGLWLFDGGTENKAMTWRSRRFETPTPTEFNSVKVCRNGSLFPAAVAFRLNAYSSPESTSPATDIAMAISSEVPRRLPKIRRERYFEIEVTAKDDIECVKIASSMGELQNG